jgi:hypothetical protein
MDGKRKAPAAGTHLKKARSEMNTPPAESSGPSNDDTRITLTVTFPTEGEDPLEVTFKRQQLTRIDPSGSSKLAAMIKENSTQIFLSAETDGSLEDAPVLNGAGKYMSLSLCRCIFEDYLANGAETIMVPHDCEPKEVLLALKFLGLEGGLGTEGEVKISPDDPEYFV